MEKFKALLELWKKKPLLSRLWVLGVLILFFSVEARTLFHHTGGSEARLLSTRRPLKAGMSLQIADLAVKHISGVSDRPLGAFTEKQVHEITGWIVKTDLRE
ncbi:MAG: hypothetical protein EBZ49_18855, partial [Proteobacteria bacterium]|nr:hypothetical protein [Pseudomonadota bacterium]